MEAVGEYDGCPRIVRGDKETENSDVCTLQRFLRQGGTDAFGGDKSFLYGRSTMNQRIESWWNIHYDWYFGYICLWIIYVPF